MNHIKQLVMDEGESVRSFMMEEMASLNKQGHRFSVTMHSHVTIIVYLCFATV